MNNKKIDIRPDIIENYGEIAGKSQEARLLTFADMAAAIEALSPDKENLESLQEELLKFTTELGKDGADKMNEVADLIKEIGELIESVSSSRVEELDNVEDNKQKIKEAFEKIKERYLKISRETAEEVSEKIVQKTESTTGVPVGEIAPRGSELSEITLEPLPITLEPSIEQVSEPVLEEAESNMISEQLQFLLRFRKTNPERFKEIMKTFDKYSKGNEKEWSDEEIEDRKTIYHDWSDEDFDEIIQLVEKELDMDSARNGELGPEGGLIEEINLPDSDEDIELQKLKNDLDEKRKIYIKTKKLYEKKGGLGAKIGRIFSRKKIGDIETNFAKAEKDYVEARKEYVRANIDKALEEQINVVEAEVEEETKETKLEKGWAKLRGFYKKLGDLNVSNIASKIERGKKEIEKMSWFGKTVTKMLSARTGLYAVSSLAGVTGMALAGAFRFVGASGLSYDFMENIAKARKEAKGMLKPMSEAEIAEMSDEEVSKRMRTIEGVVILDGVKLSESNYFGNYKFLQDEYKKRHVGEYIEGGALDEQDRATFLDSSMKATDYELEKETKGLRSGRKKRKVAAVIIGVVAASGVVGKLIRKAGGYIFDTSGGVSDAQTEEGLHRVSITPTEDPLHHVDSGTGTGDHTPETTAPGHDAIEKMTPERFRTSHYDSLVHKGEGVTHVIQRDLHANPDHLGAYKHIPGVAKIVDAHNGNFDEISGKELNRAAWLIENDNFKTEVLVKGPNDNVAVVFDEQNQRYEMGTLDDSNVTSRIYSKLDVTVETQPTIIENVGGTGAEVNAPQAPHELGGNEIKNFYPTDKGFNVIMPDGTTYEGYQWSAVNPRGGEIGNVDSLMNGDAVLSAGPNAGYVGGAPETTGSTMDVVGDFETTNKSINVPFAGELPAGSTFSNTEAMMNTIENNQGAGSQTTTSSVDSTAQPQSVDTTAKGEMSDTPVNMEEEAAVAIPKQIEPLENPPGFLENEATKNYLKSYAKVVGDMIAPLEGGGGPLQNIIPIELEGSSSHDTNNFMDEIKSKLKDLQVFDANNEALQSKLSSSSVLSERGMEDAVKEDIMNQLPDKGASNLLFAEAQKGDGILVVEGGSHAVRIEDPNNFSNAYILKSNEYIFTKDLDGDPIAQKDGIDYPVNFDFDGPVPRVWIGN